MLIRRPAPFTYAMIACNVLVSVWVELTGDWNSLPSLLAHGALQGTLVAHGEWWRIVSGAFLHAGIVHLGLNMLALYQVGMVLEMLVGSMRTGLLYAVSLVGSGVAVTLFTPDDVTVGASGAIFGLFGALVTIGMRLGRRGRALVSQVAVVIGLNLAYGFVTPGISNVGHLGGLVCGTAVGALIAWSLQIRRPVTMTPAAPEREPSSELPPQAPQEP